MARGGYTFDQIKQMDNTEIMFLYHYQNLLQREQQEFMSTALGIIWDKKSMAKSMGDEGGSLEKLFIPLSVAVNPDILDYVKKQFKLTDKKSKKQAFIGGGEYMPKSNEVVSSMEDLSKEDFMKLIRQVGR